MISLNNCHVNYEEFGIPKTVICERVYIHDNGACFLHPEDSKDLIVVDIAHTIIYQSNS